MQEGLPNCFGSTFRQLPNALGISVTHPVSVGSGHSITSEIRKRAAHRHAPFTTMHCYAEGSLERRTFKYRESTVERLTPANLKLEDRPNGYRTFLMIQFPFVLVSSNTA
jgi:hypothetical protein